MSPGRKFHEQIRLRVKKKYFFKDMASHAISFFFAGELGAQYDPQ